MHKTSFAFHHSERNFPQVVFVPPPKDEAEKFTFDLTSRLAEHKVREVAFWRSHGLEKFAREAERA